MKRIFNYTGRKKIFRESALLFLTKSDSGSLSFNVTLNLDGYKLPPTAEVYLEVYDRSQYQRYSIGLVEDSKNQKSGIIENTRSEDALRFRIKVVDETDTHGKILAVAENIITKEPLPPNSIMPVNFKDLGEKIWHIDYGESSLPILDINSKLNIIDFREIVRKDDIFKALVYPSVVKEILNKILFYYEIDDIEGDDWQNKWLFYLVTVCGSNMPPQIEIDTQTNKIDNIDELNEWVEDVAIPAFCKKFSILNSVEEGFRRLYD